MPSWLNIAGINALPTGTFIALTLLIVLWSLAWKGIALWKAARLGHKAWFVALLVVNTVGILEIIYIFAIAQKEHKAA